MWDPEPGWLNTASYGLPPRPAFEALQAVLADWRVGRTDWKAWDESTSRARTAFARLVGHGGQNRGATVETSDVAVGTTASQLVAIVAASLPDGARVVVPEVEFTSNLFPWQVHAHRGVEVVTVPAATLRDAIDERVDVVAFSLVQSATGEVADYEGIVAAARAHGALVCVDATQATGWLPFDASLADVVVCAAYKWLMAPRGASFAYFAPDVRDRFVPAQAGWYAGESVHESYYGPPLRLAKDARRFDVSPAWFSFVGAAPAMELLLDIGLPAVARHNIGLANRFRAGLGLSPSDSAIVSTSQPGAEERLRAAGVRAAVRAGALRVSFHVYSTEADVDMALNALTG